MAAVDNLGNTHAGFFIEKSNSKNTCEMIKTLALILDEEDQ